MRYAAAIIDRLLVRPVVGQLIDTRCANEGAAIAIAHVVHDRLVDLRASGRYPTNIDIVAVAQPTRLLIITVEPPQ